MLVPHHRAETHMRVGEVVAGADTCAAQIGVATDMRPACTRAQRGGEGLSSGDGLSSGFCEHDTPDFRVWAWQSRQLTYSTQK
jgi:hypothetical protein